MIEEIFGVKTSVSHLAALPIGDRIVHNGVTCSVSMVISSQATNALVEGSETNR